MKPDILPDASAPMLDASSAPDVAPKDGATIDSGPKGPIPITADEIRRNHTSLFANCPSCEYAVEAWVFAHQSCPKAPPGTMEPACAYDSGLLVSGQDPKLPAAGAKFLLHMLASEADHPVGRHFRFVVKLVDGGAACRVVSSLPLP